MFSGAGEVCQDTPSAAVSRHYAKGKTDEFMPALIFAEPNEQRIHDGDTVIFFNFRADRARQLSQAFLFKDFAGFEREVWPRVHYVTLTEYDVTYRLPDRFRAAVAQEHSRRCRERGGQEAAAHRRDGKISARHLFL